MYETEFVRKKKKRIAVSIGTILSAVGVGAFVITAFLGRHVGTFTVKLNNGTVKLALYEKNPSKNPSENPSTYLMINNLPSFEECTYGVIKREGRIDTDEIDYTTDNGPANYTPGEDGVLRLSTLNYFKYTFYVKNVGNVTAGYLINFSILADNPERKDNGKIRSLLETLRVAIYDNVADDEHESHVYAKSSATTHLDENGEKTDREFITVGWNEGTDSNPCYGLAEKFDDERSNRICQYRVDDFKKDDIRRYTIVCWLEGEDPQSINDEVAPKEASVKLGVEINAYENE